MRYLQVPIVAVVTLVLFEIECARVAGSEDYLPMRVLWEAEQSQNQEVMQSLEGYLRGVSDGIWALNVLIGMDGKARLCFPNDGKTPVGPEVMATLKAYAFKAQRQLSREEIGRIPMAILLSKAYEDSFRCR